MMDACWFHIIQVWNYENQLSSQIESWGGDLVDSQVVLVPSQVVNTNPSDSQVYDLLLSAAKTVATLSRSFQFEEGNNFNKMPLV